MQVSMLLYCAFGPVQLAVIVLQYSAQVGVPEVPLSALVPASWPASLPPLLPPQAGSARSAEAIIAGPILNARIVEAFLLSPDLGPTEHGCTNRSRWLFPCRQRPWPRRKDAC
jgi:hypothetical protein